MNTTVASSFDFASAPAAATPAPDQETYWPVSYTHLTLPTNREV